MSEDPQSQSQISSSRETRNKRPTRYKIILLGDEAVGKTSILSRCVSDQFNDVHEPTVGIDYASLLIQEYNIKLQLWDMASQDRFRCLLPQYIRGSAAIIVLYDVNRRESFLNACRMASYVRDLQYEQGAEGGQEDEVVWVLVGNKIDMGYKAREVSTIEGEETATREYFEFFECSAKANYPNPRILMNTIAQKLGQRAGMIPTREDADAAAGVYAVVGRSSNNSSRSGLSSDRGSDRSVKSNNFYKEKGRSGTSLDGRGSDRSVKSTNSNIEKDSGKNVYWSSINKWISPSDFRS